MLHLNLILILHFKLGIEAVFISNIAASSVSLLLLMPTIIKNLKLNYDFFILKKLLKFGLPYLPAGLAATLIQVIDVPILKYLTDYATVGIYKANYKLGIFMMLFVTMFQFAWQPFFLTERCREKCKRIILKSFYIFYNNRQFYSNNIIIIY
jgi:O-antigen/teichoic acid export membrane protein